MKRSQIVALAAVVLFLVAVPVYWALTPPTSGGILSKTPATPEPSNTVPGWWCRDTPAVPDPRRVKATDQYDHPCSIDEMRVYYANWPSGAPSDPSTKPR